MTTIPGVMKISVIVPSLFPLGKGMSAKMLPNCDDFVLLTERIGDDKADGLLFVTRVLDRRKK